ncbi:hypothetical protein ACFFKH_00180 [Micromonospora marina]|nr:hypothetical protein [Micromonospora marina]
MTGSWGGGFQADVRVTNGSGSPNPVPGIVSCTTTL